MAGFSPAVYLKALAALDRGIRDGGRLNTDALAARMGVNRRTVQRYVAFLRTHLNAPLEFDALQGGFRYARPWNFRKALLRWLEADE